MKYHIIDEVREKTPLIHHLTNQVVMNFTANGVYAFGAAPIMAKAEEEVFEMASHADGVLLNIGTLLKSDIQSMVLAGKAANQKGIPVVFDPVGVAATPFRSDAVKTILKEVQPTIIKGNAGELAYLVDIPLETKGVESVGDGNTEEIASKVASTFHTTAVLTGKEDIISDGIDVIKNNSGHSILTKVTGTGCLLGSIIAACLTTNGQPMEQAYTATQFYGLAAEFAVSRENVKGSGTFIPQFLDALSTEPEHLERNRS